MIEWIISLHFLNGLQHGLVKSIGENGGAHNKMK